MKKIEAVIFDWAGTTVDYGSFAPVQAFIEGFKEFGITPTVAEVREPMGMLKWNHIYTMMQMPRITEEWKNVHGRMWEKEDVDAVYEKSEQAIFKILHNFAEPKPYVVDVIKELRELGIKIGSTTGYTDDMMEIVVPSAKTNGYDPDFWCSPNSVNNMGRPYPYMIYKNMQELGVHTANNVIKVGDTVADIKEGVSAGVITVGIVEGSSVMGLSEVEYENLSVEEKVECCRLVREVYEKAGADYVIQNMSELITLIRFISV